MPGYLNKEFLFDIERLLIKSSRESSIWKKYYNFQSFLLDTDSIIVSKIEFSKNNQNWVFKKQKYPEKINKSDVLPVYFNLVSLSKCLMILLSIILLSIAKQDFLIRLKLNGIFIQQVIWVKK